jgi:hypothetical protein
VPSGTGLSILQHFGEPHDEDSTFPHSIAYTIGSSYSTYILMIGSRVSYDEMGSDCPSLQQKVPEATLWGTGTRLNGDVETFDLLLFPVHTALQEKGLPFLHMNCCATKWRDG